MTEQEARTKWCPMARVSTYSERNPAESAANRTDKNVPYVGSMCIASDCMAWEWAEEEYIFSGGKVDDSYEEVPGGLWRKKKEIRHGYCGLARSY